MDGYIKNEYGSCNLITCDEYPEITEGCVICSNKLDEYKPLNKCQSCKYGFFKTKDETCVFCNARKNGGLYCDLCEYAKDENGTDTDDIKCRSCPSILDSQGKCHSCGEEVGYNCKKCYFNFNENNSKEQILCSECYERSFNERGYCYNYDDYIVNIPNCQYKTYEIRGDIDQENKNKNLNVSYNEKIVTICQTCKDEYFKNDNGSCDFYSAENCSLYSIFSNKKSSRYKNCFSICKKIEKYVSIEYYYDPDMKYDNNSQLNNITKMENYSKRNISKLDINELINSDINYTDNYDIMRIIDKGYLCLSNSGKGGKISPSNLKKCKRAKYIINNDTYVCLECLNDYTLDNLTNICLQNLQVKMNIYPGISGCYPINIGSYNNPIYSCLKCYRTMIY